MPAVAAPDTMKRPAALPSELNIVCRGPTATELEMASSTPGPGEKQVSRATPQNSSQVERGMVGPWNGNPASLGKTSRPHALVVQSPDQRPGLAAIAAAFPVPV